MKATQTLPTRLGFWVLLLLGVFAWAPATYPGYWQGLDGFVPVLNANHTNPLAAIATTPDLWRGTGNGAFLLVYPLLAFGVDATPAVRTSFIFIFILGGFGVYSWSALHLGDRAAGLAGLVYLLLPPVLATVYIRGSLSDAMLLALLPMALAGIATYANRRTLFPAVVVVIAVVWLWHTQAGLAFFATLLLLLYAWLVERHSWSVLAVAVSGVAGALSLWPIWSLTGPATTDFADHFLFLFQLFGKGWTVGPSVPGWQDKYPFQLGIVAIVFGVLSLWHWLQLPNAQLRAVQNRLVIFSSIGFVVICALSLGISAPLWHWTAASRLLSFPWQIILLGLPLLAMLAGSLPALNSRFSQSSVWAMLVTFVILGSYRYLTPDFTQVTPPAHPVAEFGDNHNILILSANLNEADDPQQVALDVTWQTLQPLEFDYNIFLQAQTGPLAAPEIVAQLDTQPLAADRPATSWRPGEILTATYRLTLDGPLPQDIRYAFGFYDWRNNSRLPVDGGLDDKLIFYGQ